MDIAQKSPTSEILPSAAPPFPATRTIRLIGLTLCLCYLVVLSGTFLEGDFLIDPQGRPIANDFVNVVAAGRLALDGEPAAAYDWPTHKAGGSPRHRPRFCELLRLALSAHISLRRCGAGDAALRCRRNCFIAGDARRLRRGALEHSRPHRNFRCARLSRRFVERHLRAKRLPHRSADRRHARTAGAAAGACRYLSRTAHLQAAIRFAVSLGPDRGPALAHDPRCRDDGDWACRTVLARLRQRELAGLRALDADHQPHRAWRRPCRLWPAAKRIRFHSRARRRRAVGLERSSGADALRLPWRWFGSGAAARRSI